MTDFNLALSVAGLGDDYFGELGKCWSESCLRAARACVSTYIFAEPRLRMCVCTRNLSQIYQVNLFELALTRDFADSTAYTQDI
ncbi:hypothetical protein IF1G_09567 [Cordyceps javanica]|uniref:Uncharacterized protein n=1 Tax=Cordyceps javanica TaxID=43265 RepID=A0A545UR89_9HYPO|nr:hypothetical protein IF1G_09567 [Cordyceps javanica]